MLVSLGLFGPSAFDVVGLRTPAPVVGASRVPVPVVAAPEGYGIIKADISSRRGGWADPGMTLGVRMVQPGALPAAPAVLPAPETPPLVVPTTVTPAPAPAPSSPSWSVLGHVVTLPMLGVGLAVVVGGVLYLGRRR